MLHKTITMDKEFKWYIVICLIFCGVELVPAQQTYNIETMCNSAGVFDVATGIVVYLRGGYISSPITVSTCSVTLRAKNGENILSFEEPIIGLKCGVTLDIIYRPYTKSFVCDSLKAGKFSTETRTAVVRLSLSSNMNNSFGQFQLQVTSGTKPLDPAYNSSSSVSVALIVGAVVGVCAFLLLICIIGICMHKKIKRAKAREMMYAKQNRDSNEMDFSNAKMGFSNDFTANGEPSPVAKTKLLNGYNENGTDGANKRVNRPDTLNIRTAYRKPDPPVLANTISKTNEYHDDGDDTYYNGDEDKIEQPNRPKTPVTPILSALQSNPKFRKSFTENERDAEDRANRISYSTSNDSINQNRPPLPKVPDDRSRPVNLKKNQSMRKATRPDSFVDLSSTGGSEETEDDRQNDRRNGEPEEKPKHTLRPNRRKSPEKDQKQGNRVTKPKEPRIDDLRDEEENERIGMFQKQSSTRSSKRSQKSPRLGKNTKGFGHRRTGSRGDDAVSISSRTDLESLPPLQRSSSKNSLYASRSSLYSRRRRERSDSCADSMVSYAHDDIDYYRRSHKSYNEYDDDDDFGGYERPISRNDRLRMSKSDYDLRRMKESATQTLRETATQTGLEISVVVHTKRTVKRRPRSRSMSAMGTQTQKKEKSKRTKSKEDIATTDEETDVKPVVKPKPKPKPRKSITKSETVAQSDNEAVKKKSTKKRSKSDAHKTKSLEDLTQESKPDQAVPGPQVPPHHSSTVPANLQSYRPPGVIPVPPPYTTLPHGAQPVQYVTSQGQPVMVQSQPVMANQQLVNMQYPNPTIVQPQQYPVAHVPGKPRKSNWETLMELTDKQKAGIPTDTESVVSSVFTSNPPPTYQPGQPGYYLPYQQGYNQPFQQQPLVNSQYQQVQQIPQQPPFQHIQPPSVNPHQSQLTGQYPGSEGRLLSHPSHNDSSSSATTGSGSSTSGMYVASSVPQNLQAQGKSSWDKLKEMTDEQYKAAYSLDKNEKNESVV